MTPAQQIALWADMLRDMSAMGLLFCQNKYDRENYQKIQKIAIEMLALATNQSPEQLEALSSLLFERPTPISSGDAAIIDDNGKILLIQRADNQKWAMPGGALEVGETPAEGITREAFEETGVRCKPVALVGIHDSRLCGTVSPYHLYHLLMLCSPLNQGQITEEPSHANEVLDIGWFAQNDLPSDLDPGHILRIPEAFRVWHGHERAYFDR